MRRERWLKALTVAVALGGAATVVDAQGSKAAPAAKPAARDWAEVVSLTPEGGFRMGNPAARVKVIEYGSLTCPACASFSNAAKGPLAAQVRTGRVSFEFRNMVLNGVDLTASLLARCSGPANFFPMIEHLYATQPQWLGKMGALTQAQREQLGALPQDQQLGRVADLAGLSQAAARYGLPAQRAKACLGDKAGTDQIVKIVQTAQSVGVQGTPTFFVNGAKVHAHDWPELLAAIRKAGG